MSNPPGRMNASGHIFPVSNPAWLYVPFAKIVVPVSTETNYYLQEDGSGRFISEDGANLFVLE